MSDDADAQEFTVTIELHVVSKDQRAALARAADWLDRLYDDDDVLAGSAHVEASVFELPPAA